MIIFLIIALAYTAIAGLMQPLFQRYMSALCGNCSTGERYQLKTNSYGEKYGDWWEPGDKHSEAGFMAALWPVAAPYVLANMMVNDKYKAGSKAVKSYHKNKAIIENKKRLEHMEIEAGLR